MGSNFLPTTSRAGASVTFSREAPQGAASEWSNPMSQEAEAHDRRVCGNLPCGEGDHPSRARHSLGTWSAPSDGVRGDPMSIRPSISSHAVASRARVFRAVALLLGVASATFCSFRTAVAATHVLYPASVTASSVNDWFNESYATGAPQADCQNALNYSTNDVSGSADYLEVLGWQPFALPNGEVITKIEVDVDGRYDTGTSSNRFGLRVRGSVPVTLQNTPTWSQASTDDACRWRMGGSGWDITALRSSWTAADLAGLRLAARRFANTDPVAPSRARLNSLRLVVTTEECFPVCAVSTPDVDFGTLIVGTSADQSFTVSNEGSCAFSGFVAFDGPADGFTILSGGGAYSLTPGASRTIVVRFTPGEELDYSASIDVGTDCDLVSLAGAGNATPECVVSPLALDFGSVPVGGASFRSFTIRNAGGGVLAGQATLTCDGLPFMIVGGGEPYALGPGASQTVQIKFSPALAGTYTCTADAGDDCMDQVTLLGVATGQAQVSITPVDVDFGEVLLGDSADVQITLHNNGSASASGVVDLGCPAASFAVVSGGGSWTLEPGASRVITLRFRPVEEDFFTCTLETGAGSIAILAESTAPEPCFVSTTELTFGPLPMGKSQTKQFTIRNRGVGPLVGQVELDLDCEEEGFEVVSGGGPYVLAPGDTLQVDVSYTESGQMHFGCSIDLGMDCVDLVDLTVVEISVAGAGAAGAAPGFVSVGPNPFRGETVIRYALPAGAEGKLSIYDAAGRRVRTFESGVVSNGIAWTRWDGRDENQRAVMPGLYFVRLTAGSQHWSRTLLHVR